jgi:MFS transporter, YNFM family, putative membrane transport protein
LTYIETGTKEYVNASFALFIGGFLTFAILYATQPLLPLFSEEFHVSAPVASLSISLSTFVMAIAMLVVATLSDAIGKKKIMVLSMFCTSIVSILSALSPNFFTLLFLRAMLGVFIAGIPSIAMAYVAEEFNPAGIGKIMGLYISGTSIGGLAGRIITGALTDLFSWRIALIVIGILSIILSIAFLMTIPSSRNSFKKKLDWKHAWTAYNVHFSNKKLIFLILFPFLTMGSFITLFNYIGFLLVAPPYNLSQTLVGFIFVVNLFGTFSSIYLGKKADEFGASRILKISIMIMFIGAVCTLFPSLIGRIIGISIFTFGFFGCHSVGSTWVGETARMNKAQASSLYLLFYYLGSSILGSFGGYFWEKFHWPGVIMFISVLLMIGLVLVTIAGKMERLSEIEIEDKRHYTNY